MRELGAATAQLEHELGQAFAHAFLAGYDAERARLTTARCEGRREDCGAALAHVQSASFAAVLCPECDRDDAHAYATVSD